MHRCTEQMCMHVVGIIRARDRGVKATSASDARCSSDGRPERGPLTWFVRRMHESDMALHRMHITSRRTPVVARFMRGMHGTRKTGSFAPRPWLHSCIGHTERGSSRLEARRGRELHAFDASSVARGPRPAAPAVTACSGRCRTPRWASSPSAAAVSWHERDTTGLGPGHGEARVPANRDPRLVPPELDGGG